MLSICIPVYNSNVISLVSELSKQITANNFDCEIRVYNDCSTQFKTENSAVSNLQNVIYKEMQNNLGRSVIRNKLHSDANGEAILFIDGDMQVISPDFVSNYYRLHKNETVVCGGITVTSLLPDLPVALRWKYGIKRETISAEKRQKNPYTSLMTGNIMLPKSLLKDNQFDENIIGYGHEDTKLGFQLYKLKFPILHIDNALLHDGLENSTEFLAKTETGVKNLLYLWRRMNWDADFAKFVRILNFIRKYNNFVFRFLIVGTFCIFNSLIFKNLTGKNPKLFFFDLYKLYVAMKTIKKLKNI